MSATHSWSSPLSCRPRARFGTIVQSCREIGRPRHKRLAAQAQQIVLAHQPQHPLVVDDEAVLAPQLVAM